MRIQLSDHFTYRRLLRFVLPSVLMLLCTSVYTIVDGFFVSNFVGKTPFAALNLVYPIIGGVGAMGFMLGTGGAALVSLRLGEGREQEAREIFSMLLWVSALLGLAAALLGNLLAPAIARALGAEGELLRNSILYLRILLGAMPFFLLQVSFSSFFVTAEKPGLSLRISILAGVTNAVLDYLLVVVFPMGLAGAAYATAIGQAVGGLLPVVYFARRNDSTLRLTRAPFRPRALGKACLNGSSEMVTNLALSVVGVLYNMQLMGLAGEDGVAAYGIIQYVNFVCGTLFFGYAMGSAPLVSYHYGADNRGELQNLFRKSLALMLGTGVVLVGVSEGLSRPLVMIFASHDPTLLDLTAHGFRLYALAFFFMGVTVWGSSFFTALNNGVISAAISFLRTLVFEAGCILLLPRLLGVNGIWLAVVVAECLAAAITGVLLAAKGRTYHYL